VWLLIVYVVLMILGDIADYLIGLFVERMWGQQASLVVFLVLYFLFLWISWVLAVKITAPRSATARAPA
jgi:uncharacterized membrane protein